MFYFWFYTQYSKTIKYDTHVGVKMKKERILEKFSSKLRAHVRYTVVRPVQSVLKEQIK